MTEWKKVHGSTEPQEWDTWSSPTTVYQHRNIIFRPAEMDSDESDNMGRAEYWEYEERQFTKGEYECRNVSIDEFTEELIEGGVL